MVGAAFCGLAAMTQPGGGGAAGEVLRTLQAGGSAALVALYLALEFFPGLPMVQVRASSWGACCPTACWKRRCCCVACA